MLIKLIEGVTRVLGKTQGYLGLPIKDHVIDCPVNGTKTPAMMSSWEPTPEELKALNAGAPIHVTILGTQHPPIILTVGKPFDDLAHQ